MFVKDLLSKQLSSPAKSKLRKAEVCSFRRLKELFHNIKDIADKSKCAFEKPVFPEADTLAIELTSKAAVTTDTIADVLVLDYDKDRKM